MMPAALMAEPPQDRTHGPQMRTEPTDDALAAFHEGTETRLADLLGAHVLGRDSVEGTRFAVWAPRARGVDVVGSFNDWESGRDPMTPIGASGVWERFVPGVGPGALYKFRVRTGEGGVDKADPLGRETEVRPRSASIVPADSSFDWTDGEWMAHRAAGVARGAPISVYEVHLGSWRRAEDGSWLGYRELARDLLPYVRDLGFTHIELLPLTEHPHDPSWGYQTVGYYALTSRYGTPADFRAFVDEAHRLGIGVLLDWAPAHFPLDEHGLARFDGSALYEHVDPRRGLHPDWGTAIFDYGRPEVVSFLVSSARFWLEEYHLDGLRVDAVASMLYLDYSRGEGEWEPNEEGGRENLEAVGFLRRLTDTLHETCAGSLLCAEESSVWPGVTAPAEEAGLGFDLKWNMGWMNDTLEVMGTEPHRRFALHQKLTFSQQYAYSERYLLPLSHDEVVHLKRSLLSRMPGAYDEKLAGLRLLLGYQWTQPGAKLLFMGGEIGQWSEWDEGAELSWELLDYEPHRQLGAWVGELNRRYRDCDPLHALDEAREGFEWVDVHDAQHSVLVYLRRARESADFVLVLANFAAEMWRGYRTGVPTEGGYEIVLDSDATEFGGAGRTRLAGPAVARPLYGRPASLELDLPPLSVVVLAPSSAPDAGESARSAGT